jgi:hypothetical protein
MLKRGEVVVRGIAEKSTVSQFPIIRLIGTYMPPPVLSLVWE